VRPSERLQQEIIVTSLRYGVLCRFTAFVAVDDEPVTRGGRPVPVVQPVEVPEAALSRAAPMPRWEQGARGPRSAARGCAPSPAPSGTADIPGHFPTPPIAAPLPWPEDPALRSERESMGQFTPSAYAPRPIAPSPAPPVEPCVSDAPTSGATWGPLPEPMRSPGLAIRRWESPPDDDEPTSEDSSWMSWFVGRLRSGRPMVVGFVAAFLATLFLLWWFMLS